MPTISGSFYIPAENVPGVLTDDARNYSFVMQQGTQVAVSASGAVVTSLSGGGTGGWVNPGADKPVSNGGVSTKQMNIHKWADIQYFDEEPFKDNENVPNLLATAAENARGNFALAVDALATQGAGFAGESYIDQTTKSVALGTATQADGGVYRDFVNAQAVLQSDKSKQHKRAFTGTLLDTVLEPFINSGVDTTGRPLFVDSPYVETNGFTRQGRLLGRSAALTDYLAHGTGADRVEGYLGDWSRVFWGLLDGIEINYSNTVSFVDGAETIHTWGQNRVAVRVEARVGVLVMDPLDFVKITHGTGGNTGLIPVS